MSGHPSTETLPLTRPHRMEVLRVALDMRLSRWELVALRGAISAIAGPEHILFTNHLPEGGYRFAYPLIQYRFMGRHPGLICLGEGIEEVQAFFNNMGPTLNINGEERPVKVHHTWFRRWPFQIWPQRQFRYRIRRWLPFNQDTFPDYQQALSDQERLQLLSSILRGHILAMAKGIGWNIDRTLEANVTRFREMGLVRYKHHIRHVSLEAEFTTNASLPYAIGLGKGVSKGFGGIIPLYSRHSSPTNGNEASGHAE